MFKSALPLAAVLRTSSQMHAAVLFDCDRAYSNTQNAFSVPVKGISISVKIKTSNFDVFKNAVKMRRHFNGNSLDISLLNDINFSKHN